MKVYYNEWVMDFYASTESFNGAKIYKGILLVASELEWNQIKNISMYNIIFLFT